MTDTDTIHRAAALLLSAWGDPSRALPELPDDLRPKTEAEAYAIQKAVMAELGDIGGWKVGASGPGPDAHISCAPMPAANMHVGSARLPSTRFTYRAAEAEICFRLATDLDAADGPFTDEQVRAAIASCHVGVEILQTRFQDMDKQDRLSNLADSIANGAFITGEEVLGWRETDWNQEVAVMEIDGIERVRHTGNPGGEMIRLIAWLANVGAVWAGGLRAGQIITTGSWTGKTIVKETGTARAAFSTAGSLSVTFGLV